MELLARYAPRVLTGRWTDIFEALPDGFSAPRRERAELDARFGKGASTYGELDDRTFARILDWWRPGPDDVLVDLGSGTGRFALQAAATTRIGRVIAVELSKSRAALAEEAFENLEPVFGPEQAAELRARVELRHANVLETDLSHATLAYCGSTCFPETLWRSICQRVASSASGLRSFVAPRELPDIGTGLQERGHFLGGASWMPEVRVHSFVRAGTQSRSQT